MIYFIENRRAGTIKVGYAIDPAKRLRQFQTANSDRLRMIAAVSGSLADEARVKCRFASICVRGEWFHDRPELRSYISACLSAGYAIHGDAVGGRIAEQVAAILKPGERFPLPIGDEWQRYAFIATNVQEAVGRYVGFPVEICHLAEPWWSGAKGRPLSYQVEPSEGAGYDGSDSARFWEWFADEETPCFASCVQAADAFIDAWDHWNQSVKLRKVSG